MRLFKLVNKTNKTFYPEAYNEYSIAFHFDQRVTRLYAMDSTDNVNVVDPEAIISESGHLEFMGDMKSDLQLFVDYMHNTTPVKDLSESFDTWVNIMKSGHCAGLCALEYMKFNSLIGKYNPEDLIQAAVNACSGPCTKFLLERFNIKDAEVFLKDVMTLEELPFVEAIVPHMSTGFIMSLDIPGITAKHRYAHVRKYLNNVVANINSSI